MGESTSTEAWNMATATLKRLDSLLRQSSYCFQTQNFSLLYNTLMDLRRNLSPFLKEWTMTIKDENGEERKKSGWEIINFKFSQLKSDWLLYGGKININHFQSSYKIFDEIYIICYDCMKDRGLLLPKAIDVGKAILNM